MASSVPPPRRAGRGWRRRRRVRGDDGRMAPLIRRCAAPSPRARGEGRPDMKLRIVLVEPREAGNVGAVARAMKNFGFDELWIAGAHPPLAPLAGWWASGADDVVERARFAGSLHHAVRDAR